jgi:hypothetical protein
VTGSILALLLLLGVALFRFEAGLWFIIMTNASSLGLSYGGASLAAGEVIPYSKFFLTGTICPLDDILL